MSKQLIDFAITALKEIWIETECPRALHAYVALNAMQKDIENEPDKRN